MIDRDFSSKPHFEESRHFVLCNKCHVYFPIFSVVKIFRRSPGRLCKIPCYSSLQKIDNIFIIQVKKVKVETKTEFVLESEEVPKQNIRKWVLKKKKMKSMTIQDIFTIQMSFSCKKLSKTQGKIVEEQNCELEAETVYWSVVRHVGRRRDAQGGRGA